MGTGINRLALKALMELTTERLMTSGAEIEEELGRNPFETPQDVIEALHANPEAVERLDGQLYRHELAIGVAIMCALIAHYRDDACRVLGEQSLIGYVGRSLTKAGGHDEEIGQ